MHLAVVIGKRLVQLVVVVLVVTFLTFWASNATGDPVKKLYASGLNPEKAAQIREDLHLNDPLLVQYGRWLNGFVHGDLGRFYSSNESVNAKVKQSLPVTLQLLLYSQILALLFAIPLGVLTAYRSGTRTDRSLNATAFALLALPNFVLGLLLATYIGARHPEWGIPTQGYVPIGENVSEHFKTMLLPTVSLAVGQIAIYMRLLRSDMIATLQENFITTAKAKGISPRRVLFRHALRPSSLTLLTVAGLNVGTLIGGAIVIEVIFGLPGMGKLIYEAVLTNQFVALQSLVALIAIAYVILNFFIDTLYSVLDPRIRHARAA